MGRQGRATAQQLLLRATLAVQVTLALTAIGQDRVRVRAMVDQTATGLAARARTRATVDQTSGQEARVKDTVDQTAGQGVRATVVLMLTGVDLRQTNHMGKTPQLVEVGLVHSMVLGPLVATEVAPRLISHLVLWVRVQIVTRQQTLAFYAVVKMAGTRVFYHFIVPD